jgi:hypothetical protein
MLFRLLGTPPEHKRLETFPGGHVPLRRHESVAVVLRWLDAYLGPVRPASNAADEVPVH